MMRGMSGLLTLILRKMPERIGIVYTKGATGAP